MMRLFPNYFRRVVSSFLFVRVASLFVENKKQWKLNSYKSMLALLLLLSEMIRKLMSKKKKKNVVIRFANPGAVLPDLDRIEPKIHYTTLFGIKSVHFQCN